MDSRLQHFVAGLSCKMQTHSLRIEGYLHGCFSEQHVFPIILPLRYLVCLTQAYAPDLLCSECKQSMIRKSEFRRRTEQSVIKQVEISVPVELKEKEKKRKPVIVKYSFPSFIRAHLTPKDSCSFDFTLKSLTSPI